MTNLEGKKVLLVEDDVFFAELVGSKVLKAGYNFKHAKNSEEAFALLEQEIPDVVLLDILLPGGLDGFGILEQVKKNDKWKSIPIVILSNLGQMEDIEKGMSLGAFRYVVKASIAPKDIVGHIESAITSTIK